LPKSSPKLATYEAKRDRARTNEPFGPEPAYSGSATQGGAFVVHLHDARRRHWDLRLELGGTLRSFAVPRGPSLDPADKRLAVETEDHPIEYLDFEAVIPEGNYGAGAMIVWDRGRVRYLEGTGEDGVARGKIDFELTGYKLRGRFGLVLTGNEGRRRQKGKSSASSAAEPRREGLDVHGEPHRGPPQNEWLLLKKPDAFVKKESIVDAEPRSVLSGLTVEELYESTAVAKKLEERAREQGAKEGAVDARHLTAMLCTNPEIAEPLADGSPLDRRGWIYELKLDGFRIIADKRGDDAALFFRKLGSANAHYPEIVRAMRALPAQRVVLDGEVVAFDEHGRPSFQRLQGRMQASKPGARGFTWTDSPVTYIVFDLLALGPLDLRPLPLAHRKALLSELLRGKGAVRVLDHIADDGRPLYRFCEREKLEGVVAKRASSPYVAGPKRTGEWIKIKCHRDAEFVIIGFTEGEGARKRLGALDLGAYENGELVVRGKAGSGLDDRTIDELLARLGPLTIDHTVARGTFEPTPRRRTFVKPEIVVNVSFGGWTDEHRLRHPVFRGIRSEVKPEECTASPPPSIAGSNEAGSDERNGATDDGSDAGPEVDDGDVPRGRRGHAGRASEDGAKSGGAAGSSAGSDAKAPRGTRVTISNPKKIFWPNDKLTKKDLCDYYMAVAPALLPHLRDRPVVLVRYPDGIAGKNFYQWNVPQGTPSWVKTITIARDEDGGSRVTCFLVNDADTLLYIANLGCIPIHVLAARSATVEMCDFITFDFDIGSSPIAHAVELALSLRRLLDELGLVGYPKTSGQSGLHVLVPMGPGVSFATAKALVELIGRLLERLHSQIGTMERRIKERGQRVYIDTGQTGRSRTIVAPYSVRAHEGATVSTPLDWDEVNATLTPTRWSMLSVPARIDERGDPMANLLAERPDVARAVARLETMVKAGRSG